MEASSDASVLLVTKSDPKAPPGGRELLYRLNHDCLQKLFGENFHCHRLEDSRARGVRGISRALLGYIDGVDPPEIGRIAKTVRQRNIHQIFLDGSNLGQLARAIRRQCPDVRICTFFHNVEARFFLGALRAARTPRALAVLIANYAAERAAVRNSDVLICLSRRDSALLARCYGRPASHIAPMALADRLPRSGVTAGASPGPRHLLFVGGSFYANRIGIRWFADKVAPRIAMKTYVIGRGLEDLAEEFSGNDKVEIVGTVGDVSEWYLNAYATIAPIFDGSGMKTKVAEALMFGKRIIGTTEAFSGYDDVGDTAGWRCATADEFVAAIAQADAANLVRFDDELRRLYSQFYSFDAACARLATAMGVALSRPLVDLK